MRLLSARAVDWLRQHVMDLPDPLPDDHPDLPVLAHAARIAPALTGLMGRPSPVEVLVRRRLTPGHIQRAAARLLAGQPRNGDGDLLVAGVLLTPDDALWQLARDQLASDPTQPLSLRLSLAADRALISQAETALLAPLPACVSAGLLTERTGTLIALWQHGAVAPRLSHPARHGEIMGHVRHWATLAPALRCTALMAQVITCLRLIDPDHDIRDLMGHLFPLQRPDGSFPALLAQGGDASHDLPTGATPTLSVLLTLHVAVMRRWRGPRPLQPQSRPLHRAMVQAAHHLGARIAGSPPADGWLRLRAAATLTRALSQDWFTRLTPPKTLLDADRLGQLAALAFRDAGTALRLRGHLGLGRASRPRGIPRPALPHQSPQMAWLIGAPVALSGTLPAHIAAEWDATASAGQQNRFLALTDIAALHPPADPPFPRAAMARRLTASALSVCLNDRTPLAQALNALARLVLLALVFEDEPPMARVA